MHWTMWCMTLALHGEKTYAYHLSQKQNNTVSTTQSYLLQRNRNIPEKQHIRFHQIVQPNINFLSFLFPLWNPVHNKKNSSLLLKYNANRMLTWLCSQVKNNKTLKQTNKAISLGGKHSILFAHIFLSHVD